MDPTIYDALRGILNLSPEQTSRMQRQQAMDVRRLGPQWDAEAKNARSNDRNRMRNAIYDKLASIGTAPRAARGAAEAADYAPVWGDASFAEDIYQDVDAGDYKSAAMRAAVAVPFMVLPGGKMIKRAAKKVQPDDMARRLMGHNKGPLLTIDEPAGALARYRGAAPDRFGGKIPRYNPPRGVPDRVKRMFDVINDPDNPAMRQLDEYIQKGIKLGGRDWYNSEELRDWLIHALGPEAGDAKWRDYIEMVGAASTGSNVAQNIRNASFYAAIPRDTRRKIADRVSKGGITPKAAAKELGVDVEKLYAANPAHGYGHKTQKNQALNVMSVIDDQWNWKIPEGLTKAERNDWVKLNPKPKSFLADLLGDTNSATADKHYIRILSMAAGGADNLSGQAEYSAKLHKLFADQVGPRVAKKFITERVKDGKKFRTINVKAAAKAGRLKDIDAFKAFPTAWNDMPADNEYAAVEEIARILAKRYDMTPAQFQASLWMGAGDVTGLDDASQGTFMDLFRQALDKRAATRGIDREQMFNEFAKGAMLTGAGAIPALSLINQQGPDDGYR